MFGKLVTTIISFFLSRENVNEAPKEVTVEVRPKQVMMKSFFLLGDDFFAFHNDAQPKTFADWLKKNHKVWYKGNTGVIKELSKQKFQDFIESAYNLIQTFNDYERLFEYIRKWYVQEHSRFSFTSCERVFVPLQRGHLLQVLYGVDETEIVIIDSVDRIPDVITSPEDYKNNWFIGTNSNGDVEQEIAKHLITNADKQLAHYKLINDDNSKNEHYIELLNGKGITNFLQLKVQQVTTVPNDRITITRFNRYEKFNDFAIQAEKVFKEFLVQTPNAKRFDDYFMLNIWNDKNHPKNDATYVNVAFGSRPLIVSHNNRGFTSTSEEGARLCFYRMETGQVTITLFPAKTDNRKPVEDAIIIEDVLEPGDLANKKTLKSYWDKFIAYMECTSIDGNPTFWQKRKINKLRTNRHLIVDNVYQPTKRSESWNNIKEFVVKVGLSGCIIFVLQIAYSKLFPDTTPINNTEEIVNHIDSLTNIVKGSSDTLSSQMIELKNAVEYGKSNSNKSK